LVPPCPVAPVVGVVGDGERPGEDALRQIGLVVDVGGLRSGCTVDVATVSSSFSHSIAGGDGFGILACASSLRGGGSFESSHFGWDRLPAVGLRAGGGGFASRRIWRGSCRCSFNGLDATRGCRVAGSCGVNHALGSLVGSGELLLRSASRRASVRRRVGRRGLWKMASFADRSLWSHLHACVSFGGDCVIWECTPVENQ
jgi:hypothetical protein